MGIRTCRCVRASGILLLTAALILAQTGPAQADSATEQARQHYANGTKQYDMGHWDEAIVEFEKAYDLRPDPSFLYNLAQAHRRKGDLKRALDLYKNFAIKLPKGSQRDEVEEKIAAVQKQIEEAAAKPAAPAAPEMTPPPASPPPAGMPTTPPPATPAAPLAPSPAQEEPWPAFIPPPSAPLTEPAPVPETSPVVSTPVTTTSRPHAPRPGQGMSIGGIVCGAVGLAAIATGGVFSYQARALSNRVSDAKKFNEDDETVGKRAETLQWVAYGVGAAALVTGGVLFYMGQMAASDTSARVSFSPVLGPNSAGLSAGGVF